MAESTPNLPDSVISRRVVERGLASAEEVHECMNLLKQASADSDASPQSLGELLVTQGILTKRQLERVLPAPENDKPAQQVPGFKIIRRLGAGAMATVYLARQLSLDRMVAIKFLPKKYTNNDEFVRRFYAEGRAAAKLNHPNIVGALDVGQAGDRHYFVMEYVEGHTVYEDISQSVRYTESEALVIAIQTTRALVHAHQAGFIHRDVKPKNIMLTKDGVAKLADMGLARAVSDREAAEAEQGKAYGTPYYISPEQIRGELDVDFRADIYSLGATLYHMVTGQVPFDGPNPSTVMHHHLKSKLVPPDHLNTDLSAGVSESIEVCMAKDCTQRYNSTMDLLYDLEAIRNGEPPMQARNKFDFAKLAEVEAIDPDDAGVVPGVEAMTGLGTSIFAQPLFWLAVAGWATSVILLVIMIATAISHS